MIFKKYSFNTHVKRHSLYFNIPEINPTDTYWWSASISVTGPSITLGCIVLSAARTINHRYINNYSRLLLVVIFRSADRWWSVFSSTTTAGWNLRVILYNLSKSWPQPCMEVQGQSWSSPVQLHVTTSPEPLRCVTPRLGRDTEKVAGKIKPLGTKWSSRPWIQRIHVLSL